MGALKHRLARLAANTALAILQVPPIGRLFDWLALQRRRAIRRQVEQRLRASGQYGDAVSFGPFQGLKYPPGWADSRFEKIIGAYEAELHPLLQTICATPYTDIINIGAAEGYYAVGLARAIPTATVHAFELDSARCQMCQTMADLNGVSSRLRLLGAADIATLRLLEPRSRPLVVCDCEGAERELLNPSAIPWLANADILVEIHDFKIPDISSTLRHRFAATHSLQVIPTAGLNYANYPILKQLSFPEIHAMVGEERAQLMEWFWFSAKR